MKKILILSIIIAFPIFLFSQKKNLLVKKGIKSTAVSFNKLKSPFVDTLFIDTIFYYLNYVNPNGLVIYQDGVGGYVTGTNSYGNIGKMQKFHTNYDGIITEVLYFFGVAKGTGNFKATIWDDDNGRPGNRMGVVTVPISVIDTTFTIPFTSVIFPTTVEIPANHIFWAGIEFDNNNPGDTIALVSTSDDGWYTDAIYNTFEEWSDSTYHSIADTSNWGINIAQLIFPVVVYDSSQFNMIRGTMFLDGNGNGIQDSLECGIKNRIIKAENNYSMTDVNGNYLILTDTGNFYIKSFPPLYFSSSPDSIYVNFSSYGNSSYYNNFACQIIPGVRDLTISLVSWGFAPGFVSGYALTIENIGTQIESGTVVLNYDAQLNYQYSVPAHDSISGNSLFWNYFNLSPGESKLIYAFTETPSTVPLNSEIFSNAYIAPVNGDTVPINNFDSLRNVVTGAIDPNEKLVSPIGTGTQGYIGISPIDLEYTIHFQNTGTDTAFTIVIKDTLSDFLDLSTFKLLSSSHPVSLSLVNSKVMNFTFNNILLPDSNVNQLGSNGFVKYSISIKTGLSAGTEITNNAYIYFDYNPPVVTNTTLNTIGFLTDITENVTISNISQIFPNPMNVSATINIIAENNIENTSLKIYDILGNVVFSKNDINMNKIIINRGNLKQGIYFYKISDNTMIYSSGKFIIE